MLPVEISPAFNHPFIPTRIYGAISSGCSCIIKLNLKLCPQRCGPPPCGPPPPPRVPPPVPPEGPLLMPPPIPRLRIPPPVPAETARRTTGRGPFHALLGHSSLGHGRRSPFRLHLPARLLSLNSLLHFHHSSFLAEVGHSGLLDDARPCRASGKACGRNQGSRMAHRPRVGSQS